MALTDAGLEAMIDAITNIGAFTFFGFDDADPPVNHAHIGVGNSTDLFDAAETDLQGGSLFRRPMDTDFPVQTSAKVLTLQSTFGLTEANHAWEEWGVFNAVASGVMLNRKVETITGSPKTGSEVWQFTVTLTFDNP